MSRGPDRWTAYAGDTPIQDFVYDVNDEVDPTMGYIPGISAVDLTGPEPVAHYVHTVFLGSSWLRTDDPAGGNPSRVGRVVRTAFGELVGAGQAPFTRYGYAGAWGYEEHDFDTNGQGDGTADNTLNAPAAWGFPYLHVGARYYNPSTGRFLQRDPIGLSGGLNVYEYVRSAPTAWVDPEGLRVWTEVVDTRVVVDHVIWGPFGMSIVAHKEELQVTYDDLGAGNASLGGGILSCLFGIAAMLVPEPVTTLARGCSVAAGAASICAAVRATQPEEIKREWVRVY